MSKVSIIVPVYNGEKSLSRCLDSILAQDYKDIEVIVIDDGSRDDSFRIISEYAQKDKRIVPIHKENSGVSATRNIGLSLARGDYIRFVDVDDWIPFDSVKLMVRAMEEENTDMVVADFYRVVDEKISKKGSIKKEAVITVEEYADRMLLSPADFYYGAIWNKLYRKKIIDDHQLAMDENISYSEDAIFNLQYLLHTDRIFVLRSAVYYYVKTEGSLVFQNMNIQSTVKMKTGVIRYYDSFYRQILDKDDYEARKPIIYGFLVAISTDGFTLPLIDDTKKLGEENGPIFIADDGMAFELQFDRLSETVFARLLRPIAQRADLDEDDIGILYYLYKKGKEASMEEISAACRISASSCALSLARLVASAHIRIENVDLFADDKVMYAYNQGVLDAAFDKAEEDYRALCYEGLSIDELAAYASSKKKIFLNMKKTLSG
jgi:glycosyltransferase involved in cell wall biosynthesis